MFSIGSKVWTPDSMQFGQGVITDIQDGDVKVAHFDIHGRKSEKWFSGGVVQAVPTKEQLEVQASNTFRAKHLNDFNPCKANVDLMTSYLRTHFREWTADNLEAAFTALNREKKLAPMSAPVQPAPAVTAAPAAVTPATPVTRTALAVPRLAKKEIASWSWQTMLEKMKDPEIATQMEELGIPVLRGSMAEIRSRKK